MCELIVLENILKLEILWKFNGRSFQSAETTLRELKLTWLVQSLLPISGVGSSITLIRSLLNNLANRF